MQFRLSRRLLAATTCILTVGAATLAVGASARSTRHSREHGKSAQRAASAGGCASISDTTWGTLQVAPFTGTSVKLFTLTNGNGMKVLISNYGGIVESIWVPDRMGAMRNVALGFPPTQAGLTQYETMFNNPPAGGSGNTYFGAIIGRYANRIANHSFTLNGVTYNLVGNNGPNNINTLHGGPQAYNAQVWSVVSATTKGCGAASLTLKYVDPDGKNGFPGTVDNFVTYTVNADNELGIKYHSTNESRPNVSTVINLTNHTYFNLAGEGSGDVYNQLLQINADKFQPTDANLIPTGFANVAGTPFDFRTMKPIGRDIRNASEPQGDQLVTAHGYDHNWVLNGSGYRLISTAMDPGSGITLQTFTDQPGVQLYTGNFLVGDLVGTSGHTYRQSDGFTLETQHFPDTPHHIGDPAWPSVVLNPGQSFNSTTTYKFATSTGHARRARR